MAQPIRFYSSKSLFSNFSPTPVVIDDKEYSTTEHYFQALKFVDTEPEYAEEIRLASTPAACKRLGSSRQHVWMGAEKWNKIRDDVMRTALFNKALQNPIFVEKLLATGDAELIEASPRDYYWGEGLDKTGKNMLGKLLVELREKIKIHERTMWLPE